MTFAMFFFLSFISIEGFILCSLNNYGTVIFCIIIKNIRIRDNKSIKFILIICAELLVFFMFRKPIISNISGKPNPDETVIVL